MLDVFGWKYTMDVNNILDINICDLFENKYTFDKKNDWILPSVVTVESPWQINSLISLKKKLNTTKSLLNDKGEDWHEHTAKINKASFVIQFVKKIIKPEILTQAWCKFYEIASSFPIVANCEHFKSLHICEAPGAFISALNYFLCLNHPSISWEWIANSLNPYYEGHSIRNVVVDDRLIFHTFRNWHFGQDNTGDITDLSYIQDLCSEVDSSGLFDLITADGSVDCLDKPGEQELVVENLHFAEVLTALHCLSPKGCLVIKKFTFFECSTVCQLFLLNCVFEKVHIFKPFTSRPSNSEVYVICLGFEGSKSLSDLLQQFENIYSTKKVVGIFPISSIPESFIQQLENCMEFFTNLQIKAIEENLRLFQYQNDFVAEKLNDLKEACANAFVEKYSVYANSFYDSNKLYFPRKRILASFSDETSKNKKILYFQAVGDTFNNIVKSASMTWYNKILDVEKRMNVCFPVTRKRPLETNEWHYPWKEIRQRIKSKSFANWITIGRKFTCVNNSKFCPPVLLHLWNRISLDAQVHMQSHLKAEHCWNYDVLKNIFKEEEAAIHQNVVFITVAQNSCGNDSFLSYLKNNFDFKVICSLNIDDDSEMEIPLTAKTLYINSAVWVSSLNSECVIKMKLTNAVYLALKSFVDGDTLILHLQSLLTRYTVGLVFLVISLFEEFTAILPEDSATASFGQIWIFKNYKANPWSNKIIQHLKMLMEKNLSDKCDILEIVPVIFLCEGPFYSYILDLNKKCFLQRLKSLIAVEKYMEGKSV